MTWYRKEKKDVKKYLTTQDKQQIEHLQGEIQKKKNNIQMYQESIKRDIDRATKENRSLFPDEEMAIQGSQFFMEKSQQDIINMQQQIKQIEEQSQQPTQEGISEDKEKARIINETLGQFGTTGNIDEAGYITQEGTMLDISTTRKGDRKKVLDHRAIQRIEGVEGEGTDAMLSFMKLTGVIRVNAYYGLSLETMYPITEDQKTAIIRGSRNKEEVTIEIINDKGITIWYQQVKMPTLGKVGLLIQEANKQF